MQIQREKFFALTASLAGFRPDAGRTIEVADEAASEGATATTAPGASSPATASTSTTGGATPGSRPVRSFGP
ncbi:hypothetical protein OV203_36735 [Nannocystis sp. ILAH1]|nr:hypothetical protein [Nannocystis sp. ILAH1]MCY0992745.1 hypothetical protein [Nannocystis sp. ILAH1]